MLPKVFLQVNDEEDPQIIENAQKGFKSKFGIANNANHKKNFDASFDRSRQTNKAAHLNQPFQNDTIISNIVQSKSVDRTTTKIQQDTTSNGLQLPLISKVTERMYENSET